MTFSAEAILLPLQKLQQRHDELAHRDILSFDLYKRLKHMVLHFYKYAGKVEAARESRDTAYLRSTLLDVFIICLASANALNLSLGDQLPGEEAESLDELAQHLAERRDVGDPFVASLRLLVVVGGRMAKAIESADHMEEGNPRAAMNAHVPELAFGTLAILGAFNEPVENAIVARLRGVEDKNVLLRQTGKA